jgi:hypothetical protein
MPKCYYCKIDLPIIENQTTHTLLDEIQIDLIYGDYLPIINQPVCNCCRDKVTILLNDEKFIKKIDAVAHLSITFLNSIDEILRKPIDVDELLNRNSP